MIEEIVAISAPTGLNIIGRRHGELESDISVTKITLAPESGARYFSFSPLNALAEKQEMAWADFFALSNRGVHCGAYTPADSVIEAYLAFVDNQGLTKRMSHYYLNECGPSQEWVEKQEKARAEATETAATTRKEGNVINGVFPCVEEE